MILSVSRRTDIPAYYSEWFYNRVREGYVMARNPANRRLVSRINMTPEAVDGIVFWTKDPSPMIGGLKALAGYAYYFQFTLNSYARDIEPGIPSKGSHLIPAFQRLSDAIGPERVIWRYDPILLDGRYTPSYHLKYFERLARALSGYTRRCVVSFLDVYPNMRRSTEGFVPAEPDEKTKNFLAENISAAARSFGMDVCACAESETLAKFRIARASCIDAALLERISGRAIKAAKDKNQRRLCGCAESVDIGEYGTCPGGCVYCYAACRGSAAAAKAAGHVPESPLLYGLPEDGDTVIERPARPSGAYGQRSIFDL